MNAKLLTDKALEDDLYVEMMYTAGTVGFYRGNPQHIDMLDVRKMIDEQIDLLIPVIKKHIKRHVKVAKETIK